jgi:hypothetical protein
MYYVETSADNSRYANHRVICLVVIGSSFDSVQVFQVSNGYSSQIFSSLSLNTPLVCNNNNTTGVTYGAGTADSSGAHEFTTGF